MDAIFNVLSPIFWGVILLSTLVFLHEGGHFLAARACGVRVTEFFLGLPCRFNLSHQSSRIGTRFGVTPVLLGGYAAICGMDPEEAPHAEEVLGAIYRHGTVSVDAMADELALEPDVVLEACAFLLNMGSVAPVYDTSKGESPSSKYYPSTYAALPRDAAGLTIYDGRSFDRAHATKQGEPWEAAPSDAEFLTCERSHTYMGVGFWKRAFMLVAGIVVNVLVGFLLLVSVYSVLGIQAVSDVNVISAVTEGSPAQKVGLSAGDTITSINGEKTESWGEILSAIQAAAETPEASVAITFEHEGERRSGSVELDKNGSLGVSATTRTVRLGLAEAARMSVAYIAQTAQSVASLLVPQHTMEVINNSTSVVGISVMSAQAASAGPSTFLSLAALISFSLGFMNLLPIPPLDGGKLLLEAIQALTRRKLSVRFQTVVSFVGIALFGLLFIYMLGADILRLF